MEILLYKWGMKQSPLCSYGTEETIKYIADECQIIQFEEGIAKLHKTKIE